VVVYHADTDSGALADDEFEIWAIRLTANTGISGRECVSDMGEYGSSVYEAFNPDITYNSTNNEYLIVWFGDDNTGGLVNNEYEIYGQRIAPNLSELGNNDFRISDMGYLGDAAFDAHDPAVTYNPDLNEYMVVREGETIGENIFDIFGQRLNG
jgi:hypothetical protein